VGCRFPVRPVSGLDAEPSDPVHPLPAGRAVQHEPAELPLKVDLHVQELKRKHLRVQRGVVGAAESGVHHFANEHVRGGRLFTRGPQRALQDAVRLAHVSEGQRCRPDLLVQWELTPQ
jgi:hypothetical protein